FGLKKDLVPVTLTEADDFVLYRRAITRTAALNLPGIHGRPVHVGAHHAVGFRGRACDRALDLRVFDPLRERGKWFSRLISRRHFKRSPINRAPVEPRRRTGFEPSKRNPDPLERRG